MAGTIDVEWYFDNSVIGCTRDGKTVGSGKGLLRRDLTALRWIVEFSN